MGSLSVNRLHIVNFIYVLLVFIPNPFGVEVLAADQIKSMTPSKMWKFLIRSMHLSTWMLKEAIVLVSVSSLSSN